MTSKFENVINCDPTQCIASKMMKSHRIINSIFRKHLKTFDLTNSQLSILFVLSKREDLTQAKLSELLFAEKSTINRNLKRLELRKLVSLDIFPLLSISNRGLELLNDVIPAWENAMNETRCKIGEEGEKGLNVLLSSLI